MVRYWVYFDGFLDRFCKGLDVGFEKKRVRSDFGLLELSKW